MIAAADGYVYVEKRVEARRYVSAFRVARSAGYALPRNSRTPSGLVAHALVRAAPRLIGVPSQVHPLAPPTLSPPTHHGLSGRFKST